MRIPMDGVSGLEYNVVPVFVKQKNIVQKEKLSKNGTTNRKEKTTMYYELCQKHTGKGIKPKRENVEYSIDNLITLEAECFADMYAESDVQWELMVAAKEMEIWRELATKGIWYDEHGTPRFIKIDGNQKIKVE